MSSYIWLRLHNEYIAFLFVNHNSLSPA